MTTGGNGRENLGVTMRASRMILLGAVGVALTAPAAADEARRHLYQPTTITEPGEYLVTRDLAAIAGSALVIDADGVRLDLGGRTLTTGDPASPVISIAGGRSEVAIRNGRLEGGASGIVYSSAAVRTHLSIEDVDIAGAGDWGIYVFGAEHLELLRCRIRNTGTWDGIYAHGASGAFGARLVDNTVETVGRAGLYLYGLAGGEVRGNLVRGHAQSAATGDGLFLSGDPGWAAGGNTVVGNILHGGAGSAAGLEIAADSPNNLLAGNIATNNGGQGIRVASPGNRATGNTVSGNGVHGFSIATSRNVVRGNRVTGNGGHGVRVQDSFNLIEGNLIEGNGDFGISFDLAGSNAYRDNMLRGNASGAVGGAANTDGGGNIN